MPEDGSFKVNRFNALQNNVRREWHLNHVQKSNSFLKLAKYDFSRALNDKSGESDDSLPTVAYNNEILADLRLKANHKLINEHIKKDNKNIHDAIKMLKLWLHKRELLKVLFQTICIHITSLRLNFLTKENYLTKKGLRRTKWFHSYHVNMRFIAKETSQCLDELLSNISSSFNQSE